MQRMFNLVSKIELEENTKNRIDLIFKSQIKNLVRDDANIMVEEMMLRLAPALRFVKYSYREDGFPEDNLDNMVVKFIEENKKELVTNLRKYIESDRDMMINIMVEMLQ